MKRRHAMPFGAEVGPDETTRFRLWAPACDRVAVVLGADRDLPMSKLADGWFEATAQRAPPGTRYRFRVDGVLEVPDPASRWNPDDVHGASCVVHPEAHDWSDGGWTGRPWEEAVIYELHVGALTASGTYAGVIERLDYLADLGVTALELMPIADFPGRRNWGYDGALLFAPDTTYGTPDELKRFVAAAHERGLMVLLDVVYNHFGPEGNYLHAYAPQFFASGRATPWGAAINFDGAGARTVREFFVHNALYWLEEFHFDGLRIDAVHAIADTSDPDIVAEIAQAVRRGPGRSRHVHVVLENDRNDARYLARDRAHRPVLASAQWNDDVHHALHVLATGERDGYYADYAERPLWCLGRALAEGFVYQGERSEYRGAARGQPSAHLPAPAFVDFLQTHDQVGNRAFGERIVALADPAALAAALACVLLAPSVPLLFMGEEFGASTPFLFFCDFGADLAAAVTRGRREEFKRFARFRDPAARERIPDPNDPATFERSRLRWSELDDEPHRHWHTRYRELLALRRKHLVPRLAGMAPGGSFTVAGSVLQVEWTLGDRSRLRLAANLGPAASPPILLPAGRPIYVSTPVPSGPRASLAPWSVLVAHEAFDG